MGTQAGPGSPSPFSKLQYLFIRPCSGNLPLGETKIIKKISPLSAFWGTKGGAGRGRRYKLPQVLLLGHREHCCSPHKPHHHPWPAASQPHRPFCPRVPHAVVTGLQPFPLLCHISHQRGSKPAPFRCVFPKATQNKYLPRAVFGRAPWKMEKAENSIFNNPHYGSATSLFDFVIYFFSGVS